ncbi:MAG: hypothetical protein JST26_09560 [Bacteroidetes bacterium]|nr:hypothetical protein [Bacteroidota bacterium]
MLGLFTRTRVEEWEKTFLMNVFELLPHFQKFSQQIQDGLLKRVIIDKRDAYVGFVYDPLISGTYEDKKGRCFKLKHVQVYSTISKDYIAAEIYIGFGLVAGYSLGNQKEKIDCNRINISKLEIESLDEYEFDVLNTLLSGEEIGLINPSEFYEVKLEGKLFYHIMDIADGDFIAIDSEKHVYKVTQDPYEIKQLNQSLKEVILYGFN